MRSCYAGDCQIPPHDLASLGLLGGAGPMSDLKTAFEKLFGYVDGHIATVAAAPLDASLEGALLTKFRQLSNVMKDRLFDRGGYAPLANFASKIDVAYALDLISKETYDTLRLINRVRVAFAHSKKLIDFNDPEISPLLSNLKLNANIRSMKHRFSAKCKEVEDQLRTVTAPEYEVPEMFGIASRSTT
jgi:DNA-binding MltR family transcriptional regulator